MQVPSQPDPTLALPRSLEDVIHAADISTEPFDEQALWSQLVTSAPPPESCSDLERRGVVAELNAWRFMWSSDPNSEPWGIYWGPLASGRRADGKDFHNPDIVAIDPEQACQDIQWTRIAELELVPHPYQERPEITGMDFNMKDGVLKVKERAALVGYLLRQWNVDCSADHSEKAPPGTDPDHRKGDEIRLWLRNYLALYGI